MIKIRIKVIIFFIVLLITGCDKQQISFDNIDIEVDSNYHIVVDGFISNELTIQKIRISKPVYGMDSIIFRPINNAYVYLTNNNIKYIYKLSDTQGTYHSMDSIKGEINQEYIINIFYNGILYRASDVLHNLDTTMMDFPISDIKQYDNFVEIYCLQHNFGYTIPSIWRFTETTDSLGNIVYYDINNIHSLALYNHRGSLPQGLFPSSFTSTGLSGNLSDSLEIIKMSISDAYYEYLLSQFDITDWSSGIFSTTPGNTKTNVSKGGTGFFYCTSVKRYRMTYKDLKTIVK